MRYVQLLWIQGISTSENGAWIPDTVDAKSESPVENTGLSQYLQGWKTILLVMIGISHPH